LKIRCLRESSERQSISIFRSSCLTYTFETPQRGGFIEAENKNNLKSLSDHGGTACKNFSCALRCIWNRPKGLPLTIFRK